MAQNTEWNLVELTGRLNHIFVGPLAVLFFGGILFRRAGKSAALMGFVAGTLMSLFVCFGKEWFGMEVYQKAKCQILCYERQGKERYRKVWKDIC